MRRSLISLVKSEQTLFGARQDNPLFATEVHLCPNVEDNSLYRGERNSQPLFAAPTILFGIPARHLPETVTGADVVNHKHGAVFVSTAVSKAEADLWAGKQGVVIEIRPQLMRHFIFDADTSYFNATGKPYPEYENEIVTLFVPYQLIKSFHLQEGKSRIANPFYIPLQNCDAQAKIFSAIYNANMQFHRLWRAGNHQAATEVLDKLMTDYQKIYKQYSQLSLAQSLESLIGSHPKYGKELLAANPALETSLKKSINEWLFSAPLALLEQHHYSQDTVKKLALTKC